MAATWIQSQIAKIEAAQAAEQARKNAPLLAAGSYEAPINPYYTRPQQTDALAPLAMLNQYRQSGQMPERQSTFTPYNAPPAPQYTAQPAAPQATAGGK